MRVEYESSRQAWTLSYLSRWLSRIRSRRYNKAFHAFSLPKDKTEALKMQKSMKPTESINIGVIICNELKNQGRSVTWFAKALGVTRIQCYRIFKSYSIDTITLLKISVLLNVDFFKLYSNLLK